MCLIHLCVWCLLSLLTFPLFCPFPKSTVSVSCIPQPPMPTGCPLILAMNYQQETGKEGVEKSEISLNYKEVVVAETGY